MGGRTDEPDPTVALDDARLAETAAPPRAGVRAAGARLPGPGDRVGRYIVTDVIGRGGMGAVFRALDPDLGRTVAIKLIRTDVGGSDMLEQRLVRESKAMAQLGAHDNVLTIHDIGRFDGQVFIAMELAPGGTLTDWLDAEKRDWRDIVARFVQAGRGLRAAHEAGLVHRDFKPDNVLLTADGAVRVADFGLVGSLGEPAGDAAEAGEVGDPRASQVVLTQHGAILGTPRYMAPEQYDGGRAGAAADQWAFAVSLYEALYGEHPFGGDSWAELIVAVTEGVLRPAPAVTEVPGGIRKTLARALRVDPHERWPSMSALLTALDSPLTRRPPPEPDDPERRARAQALRRDLDEATALADRARYDDALPRLEAVAAGARALGHAPLTAEVLFALGALRGNMGAFRAAEEVLAAAAVEAARARDDGLAARAWSELLLIVGYRSGRIADAALLRPAAEAALARCDDDPFARARYHNIVGILEEQRGRYGDALALFEQAADDFEEAFGPTSAQLGNAVNNSGYTLRKLGRYDDARARFERARQIHETALGSDHPWIAIAHNNLGELELECDDPERALAHHERALAIRERALRGDHPHLALSIHNIGRAQLALGRAAPARDHLERALAMRTAALGDNHLDVADSLAALGDVRIAAGAHDDGLALHRRALALVERLTGGEHLRVATAEDQLGAALCAAGRPEEALGHHERAIEIAEVTVGGEHPGVARSFAGLAAAQLALGRTIPARAAAARAVAIARAARLPASRLALLDALVARTDGRP